MPKPQKNILERVQVLADSVKEGLRKQGIIVPKKLKNGSIVFDNYTVVSRKSGWFILDKRQESILGPINMPQTAIVLANTLALGRAIDDKLIENDRWYGFKYFDEEVYTNSANKSIKNNNWDKADWCFTRASIAKVQKEHYMSYIMSSYNRLKMAQNATKPTK
jgi:hypothetical protein